MPLKEVVNDNSTKFVDVRFNGGGLDDLRHLRN